MIYRAPQLHHISARPRSACVDGSAAGGGFLDQEVCAATGSNAEINGVACADGTGNMRAVGAQCSVGDATTGDCDLGNAAEAFIVTCSEGNSAL